MSYRKVELNLDQEDMNKGFLSFFTGFKDAWNDFMDKKKGKVADLEEIRNFVDTNKVNLENIGHYSKEIKYGDALYKYLPAYNLYIKDGSEFDITVICVISPAEI